MPEFWEEAFEQHQVMWGEGPAASALLAGALFAQLQVRDVLIPGIGYGRNAKPFLERGMAVTGIEISASAIDIARSVLKLDFPIHHGSVSDMPFDTAHYDGIFCYGLIYLLDAPGRAKLLADCYRQLRPGAHMVFSVVSKAAPMYGQGTPLGEDWFERLPGLPMYFYDAASIEREFGPYGLIRFDPVDEPAPGGALPFITIVCQRAMTTSDRAVADRERRRM